MFVGVIMKVFAAFTSQTPKAEVRGLKARGERKVGDVAHPMSRSSSFARMLVAALTASIANLATCAA